MTPAKKHAGTDLAARRYQEALSHQVYGIVLVSEDGHVEFVNQQLCDMFDLDAHPSELVGLTSSRFLELLAPTYDAPSDTVALIRNVLAANVKHLGEEIKLRDGRTLLVDYSPIMVDGEPSGRLWQHRDITETKDAEYALRQSEEKFAIAFQSSPYAMSISRLEDGVFLDVNEALTKMCGYSRDELIGRSSVAAGLWADATQREEVAAALRQGQDLSGREFLFRKKNGDLLTGLYSGQVVHLSQGPCILSSIDDFTARKRVEQDLQKSRRLLSDLVEHSGALICVKDSEGRYELVNKRWEEVTGLMREDTIGRTDAELFPGPVARQFRSNDLEAMSAQTEIETEETLEDERGRRFFISIKFPLYEDDGTIRGVCAMITEITARKEVEEQIRHLATHDGLTDLPSLRLAKDRLMMAFGMARRQRTSVAVMFVDLDGFKTVNDTLGHEAGDRVLKKMAQRLLSCVRETDTVARVGGDEFLVVATGLHSEEDAARIAEKIVRQVAEPVVIDDGRRASVGASVGVALCQVCGEDPDRLIKLADAAMYRVKNSGKNGYSFADPSEA